MSDSTKPKFTPRLYNDVLCIGAGFSGLAAVASLQKAGFNDVHVYERWESLGGTWWINQ